jgi:IS5 family transposase
MVGFERYAKPTRRAGFLAEMERIVPWSALCGLIEPFYPKPGNGRPPVGVERMLRLYFLQQWFNLSDPAVEEALYDSLAMRRFVGIDLGREPVPDETTVCRFRHLLEEHDLGRQLFDAVQRHLADKGLKVATGTIVDATIISAPSSTKNAEKARDPEMHQTKKGNQWYFGMKAHLGVDSRTKLIHAVVATPANVADSTVLAELLHGNETRVCGDQAYRGQRAVIREHAPRAQDFVNRRYRHRGVVDEAERAKNRTKSKVRAKSLPSRKRGSNIRSGSSSGCSALPRCAIAGSQRTPTASSSPVRSPICLWRAAIYRAANGRNLSDVATDGCRLADPRGQTTTHPLPPCHWLLQFQWRISIRNSLFRPSLIIGRRIALVRGNPSDASRRLCARRRQPFGRLALGGRRGQQQRPRGDPGNRRYRRARQIRPVVRLRRA